MTVSFLQELVIFAVLLLLVAFGRVRHERAVVNLAQDPVTSFQTSGEQPHFNHDNPHLYSHQPSASAMAAAGPAVSHIPQSEPNVEQRYRVQLFYVPIHQPTDWRLYFVVTRDHEAEIKRAAEMYPKRNKAHDVNFAVLFGQDDCYIKLDIPSSCVTQEGWNIITPHSPQIAKEEVDRFRSSIFRRSSIVPSCELHIRWDKNQEPPFLNGYHISLKGTADRNDYFKVSLNPRSDGGRTGNAVDTGFSIRASGRGNSDYLTSRDHADIIRYLNGVNIYILQNLGLALGITYSRLQNTQSLSYAADLVDLWLLKIDQVNEKGGPTWATLESVMRDKIVGLNGIADDIRKDKLSGCDSGRNGSAVDTGFSIRASGRGNSDYLTTRDHFDCLIGMYDILRRLGVAPWRAAAELVALRLQKIDQLIERGHPHWVTVIILDSGKEDIFYGVKHVLNVLTTRDHFDNLIGMYILQRLGVARGRAIAELVALWLQNIDQLNERGGPTSATLLTLKIKRCLVTLLTLESGMRHMTYYPVPEMHRPSFLATRFRNDILYRVILNALKIWKFILASSDGGRTGSALILDLVCQWTWEFRLFKALR